jgi:hypothetical protein
VGKGVRFSRIRREMMGKWEYEIEGVKLENVEGVMYLGVWLDRKL